MGAIYPLTSTFSHAMPVGMRFAIPGKILRAICDFCALEILAMRVLKTEPKPNIVVFGERIA